MPIELSVGQWLYEWQTLVGAVLAIGAAGLSVWYLRKQISQAETHEQRRLERRLAAARATLPLTLSAVLDYAEKVMTSLKEMYHQADESKTIEADAKLLPPPAPVEVIPALERMIEAVDDSTVSARLASLVSEIQILHSRLVDSSTKGAYSVTLLDWVTTLMIQAAVVYAQASSMFYYARRRSKTVSGEIVWEDVTRALNNMKVWDHAFPDVWKKVRDRDERDVAPES